ncbi:MAG: lysophospholipid acyltransferase family protein [Candidatus Eiseniibacteriota bacterium]
MLLAAVTGVARSVPLSAGYRIADAVSRGHRLFSARRRRAVQANLRTLLGEGAAVEPLEPEVFRNYGRFLFEFLRGPDPQGVAHDFQDWSVMEAARARGAGVVLAVLHTGNWELTGARMARLGIPVHAVAGVQLNRAWTRELRRRQEQAGIHILPPSIASWRSLPRILEANGVVALLVDGDVFRRGIPVRLGGGEATLPGGPARLAAKTGAALLPLVCFRTRGGKLGARFLPEVPVRDDSAPAVRDATQALAEAFEKELPALAGQWLVFRPFFATGCAR